MNAPTPSAVVQQNIALDLLFPSPTNPRKRFNQTKLEELAASIRTQGVLQPILVRPVGEQFEVIAGERRYRASKLAGLAEIPTFVRTLTNIQVLHAQVIENLQRDDLHPIEEAEGYENLMQQVDESGNKYTADTIAAEVGKSRGYVYGRLKLLDLCQEARDAFFNGELENSTCQIIARIPTHKLQLEALTHIVEDGMSFRQARDYIQRRFMLDLATAPFEIKDANLLEKAGACTECLKRTGNQPELFDDVSSKDVCTDTGCFAEKKTAHIAATIKAAEANGDEVLRKEDAAKLLTYRYMIDSDLHRAGLVRLTDEIPDDADERTWEDALNAHKLLNPTKGKSVIQKTIIENPYEEEIIVAINAESAMKALEKAGFKPKQEEETPENQARNQSANQRRQQQQEKNARIDAEVEQINKFRSRLFTTLQQQIADGNVPEGLYRILAGEFLYMAVDAPEDAEDLVKRYSPEVEFDYDNELAPEINKHLANLDPQQLFLLMIDSLMVNEMTVSSWNMDSNPERMLAIAKEIGVDAEAIQKEVFAETTPKKPTKAKKGKTA
jgi:ParB/RepB/Spo0J family partition protein